MFRTLTMLVFLFEALTWTAEDYYNAFWLYKTAAMFDKCCFDMCNGHAHLHICLHGNSCDNGAFLTSWADSCQARLFRHAW